MNKLTKGALAMVLAGSVTFSITNALLGGQSTKRLVEDTALAISEHPKKAEVIHQANKAVKDQTPPTNAKDVQSKLSPNIVALENENKSDRAITAIQQNTEYLTARTTTKSASKNTTTTTTPAPTTGKPMATTTTTSPTTRTNTAGGTTTIPATSRKASTATAASPAAGTNAASAATTKTNKGQQVSQAAKENAANRDKKENNGKNL
ncbi:hypothetical protein V7128_24540 [Neobacillus vireti]|uniref:hypothetical protein n=1 Tax=Neobacillus vireti TaxID=220686 RepID=UPI002FFD7E7D